jgi:lysozyme family protein
MQSNFTKALALVLRHEGGYSNHPQDPGGATMRGVTQRVYDAYRRRTKKPTQPVRSIDDKELQDIYKKQYWDAVAADSLPSGLDYAMFDYAVNSGPTRATKDLQRVLGERVDGHVGQILLDAVKEANPADLIEGLCSRRLAFLKRLRTWSVFSKGWSRRVNDVLAISKGMDKVVPDTPPVQNRHTARAEEEDMKTTAKPGFMDKVTTAVASGGVGVAAVLQGVDWRVGVMLVAVVAIGLGVYMVFIRKPGDE